MWDNLSGGNLKKKHNLLCGIVLKLLDTRVNWGITVRSFWLK